MDKVVDNQKGVSIFAGDGVERVVVLYELKFAVLLFYEEDWGSDQRLRGVNSTISACSTSDMG